MKRYIALVKAVFSTNIKASKNRKTGKLKKGSYLPMLLSGLLLLLIFGYNYVSNMVVYQSLGIDSNTMLYYLLPVFSLVILYGFFQSLTLAFSTFFFSENEPFLSLPISGFELLSARFLVHLLNTFCYGGGLIFVYCIASATVFNPVPIAIIASIFVSIIVFLTMSFLTFLISCLVCYFFDLNSKAVLKTILMVLFSLLAGASLITSYLINPSLIVDFTGVEFEGILEAFIDAFEKIYNGTVFCHFVGYLPIRTFLSESGGDYINLFYIFLILVGTFLLSYFVGQKLYLKAISSNKGRKKKTKDKDSKIKKSFKTVSEGQMSVFIKREFKLWNKSPALIVSSILSSIIIAVCFVFLGIILTKTLLETFANSTLETTLIFLLLHFLFLEGLMSPLLSYISTSLEGKNFILLKTFPINTKKYVISKVVPCLTVSFTISLISTIFCFIFLDLPYMYILGLFVSLLAFSIFDAFVSLIFGIIFARFSYDNPMEIVQRGFGTFLLTIVTLFTPIFFLGFDMLFIFFAYELLYIAPFIGAFFYIGLSVLLFFDATRRMDKLFKSELNIF